MIEAPQDGVALRLLSCRVGASPARQQQIESEIKMSNALKNVVDAGKNVVDAGTSTLSDLVDDARSLIEDLPPLANARRKQSRKNWSSLIAVVFLVFVAMVVAKQVRSHSSESVPERTTL